MGGDAVTSDLLDGFLDSIGLALGSSAAAPAPAPLPPAPPVSSSLPSLGSSALDERRALPGPPELASTAGRGDFSLGPATPTPSGTAPLGRAAPRAHVRSHHTRTRTKHEARSADESHRCRHASRTKRERIRRMTAHAAAAGRGAVKQAPNKPPTRESEKRGERRSSHSNQTHARTHAQTFNGTGGHFALLVHMPRFLTVGHATRRKNCAAEPPTDRPRVNRRGGGGKEAKNTRRAGVGESRGPPRVRGG